MRTKLRENLATRSGLVLDLGMNLVSKRTRGSIERACFGNNDENSTVNCLSS